MNKYLTTGMLIVAALGTQAAVASNKLIEVDPDIKRLARMSTEKRGNVVITAVTDKREFSVAGDSDPGMHGRLIGQFDKKPESEKDKIYDVVLKDEMDATTVMRDFLEMMLVSVGYNVIDSSSAGATNASTVSVEVNELWFEIKPLVDSNRMMFECSLAMTIDGKDPELGSLGKISVTDYRNGSRPTNWKSYRNTIGYTGKKFIDEFQVRFNAVRGGALD